MKTLTNGPIIYVDDDEDDRFLFERAIRDLALPNEIRSFADGLEARSYLETTQEKPLLILCDINMPVMNGLEFRRLIDADEYLRKKSIPFVFYTTAAGPELVNLAYEGTIQGFHVKATEFSANKEQLNLIITYWKACIHPNSF
ncbi:response regulator [Spirosoma sp. BT702]|uniref:Response regulator n=1 Tax=Spirosoma profusum TaxID=2771354 RepID=A0A926Y3A5_9BACT|nr:response regulator [Spirosoma profusum]MBD2703218.1 response regulator [Spirosoma profusum]